METSEFDFMERGEQDNKAWQTFPDDLSKSEQWSNPDKTFSLSLEMILKADFKFCCSEYPWIEHSLKEDALFGHAGASGEKKVWIFLLA